MPDEQQTAMSDKVCHISRKLPRGLSELMAALKVAEWRLMQDRTKQRGKGRTSSSVPGAPEGEGTCLQTRHKAAKVRGRGHFMTRAAET